MIGETLKLLGQYNSHDFVIKKQGRPKTCPGCFRRIKFSTPVMGCNNCDLHCHPKCWKEISHLCSGFTNALLSYEQFIAWEEWEIFGDYCCPWLSTLDLPIPSSAISFIPYPVLRLVNEIELRIQPGLYCLRSPDEKHILKNITSKFMEGKVQNLKIYSVHTLTTSLKHFLQNLDPIIPVWHITTGEKGESEIEFNALPKPNKFIFAFIALHLKTVALNPNSRMTLFNLARVFAPILTKQKNDEVTTPALFKLLNNKSSYFVDQLRHWNN